MPFGSKNDHLQDLDISTLGKKIKHLSELNNNLATEFRKHRPSPSRSFTWISLPGTAMRQVPAGVHVMRQLAHPVTAPTVFFTQAAGVSQ